MADLTDEELSEVLTLVEEKAPEDYDVCSAYYEAEYTLLFVLRHRETGAEDKAVAVLKATPRRVELIDSFPGRPPSDNAC